MAIGSISEFGQRIRHNRLCTLNRRCGSSSRRIDWTGPLVSTFREAILDMKKLNQHILSAYKEAGAKWLSHLPGLVQKLSNQWQLSNLTEYENLSWNYVAKASQSGQSVVLKISFDLSSLQREVHALNTVSPGSCVKVIDFNAALCANEG